MKLEPRGDTLRVSAIRDLGAANAKAFRDWVRENVGPHHKHIEIDLSTTTFIDSSGLGALVALHKLVQGRCGQLRLFNPQPPVQQLLQLTRFDQIFPILKDSASPAAPTSAIPKAEVPQV